MPMTMRQLCNNKPSEAVRAMVKGLRELPENDHIVVDMGTFGKRTGGVCYGCAATCTVIQLACEVHNPTHLNNQIKNLVNTWQGEHGQTLGLDNEDVHIFENVIDELRRGYPQGLLRYFELSPKLPWNLCHLPHLLSYNYRGMLPVYEEFAEHLESLGM